MDKRMVWFYRKGMAKWVKVNAEPGDLLLWDSRTPHYNLSPEGECPRFRVYTCYMPAADASKEELELKSSALRETKSTTHWPATKHVGGAPVFRDGKPCPYNTVVPRQPVKLSDRGLLLTVIPYLEVA